MRRWYGDVFAKIISSGSYYHSGAMHVEEWDFVEEREQRVPEVDTVVETTIVDNMRALADWLYETVQAEYYYLTSDAAVAEALEANEIEENLDDEHLSHAV